MTETKEIEDSLTMQEILKTIRIVVSQGMEEETEKEEILELTDIVEIGDQIKLNDKPQAANSETKDVFDKIDQVIGKPVEQKKISTIAEKISEKIENQYSEDSPLLNKSSTKSEKILQDDETLNEKLASQKMPNAESEILTKKAENNLISKATLEASASALKSLISEGKEGFSSSSTEKTLESLVKDSLKSELSKWLNSNVSLLDSLIKDLLKTELSEWLNDNLPSLIRESVEKEIKQIVLQSKKS